MKKVFGRILSVLIIVLVMTVVADKMLLSRKYDMRVISCVSDLPILKLANAAKNDLPEMEDIRMQIIYQLARRSVVKVAVKKEVGSGIIWKIDDGIVIAANKHLLMNDVVANITFCGGITVKARIVGYSQQYDIGFAKIHEDYVTSSVLRDIYEVIPEMYDFQTQEDREAFAAGYADGKVLQVGAYIDANAQNCSTGKIKGLVFEPVFNTNVLETNCYSRAGMSGGGVFDISGRFLGMISGGDVAEDSAAREAEITYSIPPQLIETEYIEIVAKRGKKYW